MDIIGVIPARYESSRFPGKPLADICGKPMIYQVYQNAARLREFKDVYVATDDSRIKDACESLRMNVIMTSGSHRTGTDRVGEVAGRIKADIYVNIQGDEPLLEEETIRAAIRPLLKDESISVTNLMALIKDEKELASVTVPKVAVNAQNEAVFLSRLPIPYHKASSKGPHYKQVCVYGFRPAALEKFCRSERGVAEGAEDIELLRFIEIGIPVLMVEVRAGSLAVDVPEDLEMVREVFLKRKAGVN